MTNHNDDDYDDFPTYTVLGLANQPSMMDTIIQFVCEDADGDLVFVAADHRPARDIIEALCDGEEDIRVCPEPWSVRPCPSDWPVLSPATM
jgi:hypothetical protein